MWNLETTRERVDELIYQIYFNLDELEAAYQMLMAYEDRNIQSYFNKQIIEYRDEYIKVCNKLKIALEVYFKYEKEANAPRDLAYYKIYRNLEEI